MSSSTAFAHIGVGRTKTGKTTFSKNIIIDLPVNRDIYIYDVNKEYNSFYPEPFIPFEAFLNSVKDVTNSFILFEEATIFFNSKSTNKIIVDMLVRKRHTNNVIYLNFHSFRSVPRYIFDMIDYVTIFKTNDNLKIVKEKYDDENFLKTFEKVQDSDDPFDRKTFDLYYIKKPAKK